MTEHVETDRRLDGQKIAVAWIVYGLTLAMLFLVSVCGFPGSGETTAGARLDSGQVHAATTNASTMNAATAIAAAR